MGTHERVREQSSVRASGHKLRAMVFDVLLGVIGDGRKLLLAPDGDLNLLPFETLPLSDERDLIDDYEISYVSVGRDVARFGRKSSERPSEPLVVADPDFDLHDSSLQLSSPGPQAGLFQRLPGSLDEGNAVARMLGVSPVLGPHARKSFVMARRSPAILHFATHGFVLEDKTGSALDPADIQVGMIVEDENPMRRLVALNGVLATPLRPVVANQDTTYERLSGQELRNPLLRSGVALAGANTWLRGDATASEADNGILTAMEVTGMDLRASELVVLSACETGLGEFQAGEGIFGLRRAFQLAGAKAVVSSLWKVADGPTRELMEKVYSSLSTDGPAGALRRAQLAMKQRYSANCWGAFICHGDPGPVQRHE